MQALKIANSETCRHLEQLHDAERHLCAALAAARESIARCEDALNALAESRLRASVEQASSSHNASLTHLKHSQNRTHASHRTGQLTPREAEVLQLIASGLSNRQIAETLYLSPRTIERHIANIYLKIDAHSKADATAYALFHRLA